MKRGYLAAVAILILAGTTVFIGAKRLEPAIPTPVTETQEKINLIITRLRQEKIELVQGPELAPDNKTLSVTIDNDAKILFSLDKNIQNQILSLQLILKRVRMEGKQARLIDLTLNSPHVVF